MTSSTYFRISFRSPASQYQSTANVYWQVPQTQFRRSTSGSYPGTRARWPTEQQKFRRGIEEPSETGRTGSSGRRTPCQSQESGSTSSGQRSFSCQGEWSPCTTFQSFIFLFSLFHLLPSILLIPFWCPLSFFFLSWSERTRSIAYDDNKALSRRRVLRTMATCMCMSLYR